ncbi:MAG: hypothetical protein R3C61_16525 [Bacteroidia bacterium]
MDLSSTETWVDFAVALISVAAVIIGLVTVRKMLKEESRSISQKSPILPEVPEKENPEKMAPSAKKETISEKLQREMHLETVAAKIEKKRTPSPALSAEPKVIPIPPPPVYRDKKSISDKLFGRFRRKVTAQTGKSHIITTSEVLTKPPKEHIPPRLKGEQLSLVSPNKLLFRLKNEGHKLIYKKIQTGPNNELNVTYEPPVRRMNLMLEEYDQGEIITFSLTGSNVISQTYHFIIHYGDMAGNFYTQQIGGLGREFPIVDAPVKA